MALWYSCGANLTSNLTVAGSNPASNQRLPCQLLMEDVGRFGLQEDILNMRHDDDDDERALRAIIN